MKKAQDFLVEIGTEELPPKALRSLMDAFASNVEAAVDEARLAHGRVHAYASPRRLAVLIKSLELQQKPHATEHKGPPVSVVYNDAGDVTAAGRKFLDKAGIGARDLGTIKTEKGEWVSYTATEEGKTSAELMPELIEAALAALPIPRRMRWGEGDAEFVRPVHWVVLLHGDTTIKTRILNVATGNKTRGHRFHAPRAIIIKEPADYLNVLKESGHVVADFDQRRKLVQKGAEAAAKKAGGKIVAGESLYDEVTALVEWPVPVTGSFDEGFLELPREVIVSTLTGHQRYFPIADKNGALLPQFITIANIESRKPDVIREGNERVIRPRLADGAFFWDNDRRTSLAARQDSLREVVYQRGLGSLYDKSTRIATLTGWLAEALDIDAATAQRAAMLCKCDLLTGMVGEFPDLQGIMGRYYALADGEPDAVAAAIGDHYLPRFAGDRLPAAVDAQLLAVADKLDTLAGIITIGKKPSGNRDPFGLRRAALGIVRIIVECGLDIDLRALIDVAVAAQPAAKADDDEMAEAVYSYVTERLRRYFLDRDAGLATETFAAVMARQPSSLVDFDRRLAAVQAFMQLESASSLAAANKRIANILKQAGDEDDATVKEKLLSEDAELALWSALGAARQSVQPLLDAHEYTQALTVLAELRAPVDRFFDDVMVMADDAATKANRLALLRELRALFLDIADISRLAVA